MSAIASKTRKLTSAAALPLSTARSSLETSLSRSCSTAATKRSMSRLTAFAKSHRGNHECRWCELPREFRCAPLLAPQEENEWPREDHTNPFAQPEHTGIVRVHQKSQDQPGAKVEPSRRTTALDRRAQAVLCRRRHQPRRPAPTTLKVELCA